MPNFFIHRPVFAWVIAIFITLAGVLALPQLPVARFPSVAPPSVSIYATYPGATPQTLNDGVVGLIERELSGVKKLLYYSSSTESSGSATITATFLPGTDPELAQIDVQNRIKAIEPRLPQVVRQNGLQVEAASAGFLLIVGLSSRSGATDELALGDYLARNVLDEIKRVPGVGRVQFFGSEQAMRVWIDPGKLSAYALTVSDVTAAIAAQNVQIAPGRVGEEPATAGQRVTTPLTVQGQLQTPEEFRAIILVARPDGAKVTLGDVARVELASQTSSFANRENGRPTSAAAVQLSPGANAVKTSAAIRERMDELASTMPSDIRYSIAHDTAPFVKVSIEKVLITLAEAMVLVFLVMLLFLQKIRYTLIPAIVAPIALLGACAVMLAAGYSINVLTMFGMVLAIGIIVDDAIVVVENVERIMAEEGLPPRAATEKAMREITGAVIGITLVLTAVFVPMALADGSVGAIYRQFALSMVVAILFSAFLALSLTPALCATLLKPVDAGHGSSGVFGAFNRAFARLTEHYRNTVGILLKRPWTVMTGFFAISGLLIALMAHLPSSFLPDEDQGYFLSSFQLPTNATAERTEAVIRRFEAHVMSRPAVRDVQITQGYGFSGAGPNTALAFTVMKDWDKRNGATIEDEIEAADKAMADVRDGTVMNLMPPAIDELGTSSGFELQLQDRANRGMGALYGARDQLIAAAARSALVTGVYADALPDTASVRLSIDREKAEALGVPFSAISDTLSSALGSAYVNDFPNQGRLQQVIVQADASVRMRIDDILKIEVRNLAGGMVPLSAVVAPEWGRSPLQMARYNGFPSIKISGGASPGRSSGEAMEEMERLAAALPAGFAVSWTGQSLEDRQSQAQAPMLIAISILVVFLVLAALYESWSIPLAVVLVVPLGLIGAVLAVTLRGMPNDIFFKVGMITIIGLSAKNAILIVEFANSLYKQGSSLIDATIEAARLRLRPILMTSLAFTLGVVPLVLARGASSATQQAIGTGVFGGMLTATALAIFFVPLFFVTVIRIAERLRGHRGHRRRAVPASHTK